MKPRYRWNGRHWRLVSFLSFLSFNDPWPRYLPPQR